MGFDDRPFMSLPRLLGFGAKINEIWIEFKGDRQYKKNE
jgi:hypothetical protein